MAEKKIVETPSIRIVKKLSDVFERMQDVIRERAYHISLNRDPDQSDSMADWLDAQLEVVTPIDLEVKEQKKNIVVETNLKGFSASDVEIEVEGDTLKVFGSHSTKEGDANASISKSVYFFQSVQLPDAVDLGESQATLFKNGKLKITLPRKT